MLENLRGFKFINVSQIWVTRKFPEKKGQYGEAGAGPLQCLGQVSQLLPAPPMPYLMKEGSSCSSSCLHHLWHISTMGTDQLAMKPYQRGFKHRAESPFSIRTHNSPRLHQISTSPCHPVPLLSLCYFGLCGRSSAAHWYCAGKLMLCCACGCGPGAFVPAVITTTVWTLCFLCKVAVCQPEVTYPCTTQARHNACTTSLTPVSCWSSVTMPQLCAVTKQQLLKAASSPR